MENIINSKGEDGVNGRETINLINGVLGINESTENKHSVEQDKDQDEKNLIPDDGNSNPIPGIPGIDQDDIIPGQDSGSMQETGQGQELDIPKVNKDEKIKEIIEEDKLGEIISYFKKIKNSENPNINKNGYDKKYGWFYCGKQNEANGSTCEPGKEICPNCMKKTQELYKLKPHYLINSNGRICTYKKNKIYCLCKLTRFELNSKSKDDKQNGINYSITYTCGHTGQCEPCKHLTSIMDKYFDSNLMKKLKKRDETDLN